MEQTPGEVNVPFMLAQVMTQLGDSAASAHYMAIAQDIEPKIASIARLVQSQGPGGRIMLDATGSARNAQEAMDEAG